MSLSHENSAPHLRYWSKSSAHISASNHAQLPFFLKTMCYGATYILIPCNTTCTKHADSHEIDVRWRNITGGSLINLVHNFSLTSSKDWVCLSALDTNGHASSVWKKSVLRESVCNEPACVPRPNLSTTTQAAQRRRQNLVPRMANRHGHCLSTFMA